MKGETFKRLNHKTGGDMGKSRKEVREEATRLSRELRRRQTKAEKIFWEAVRNGRFHGKRFLRQHPFFNESDGSYRFYIVDFYCHAWKVVIELDGRSHDGREEDDVTRSEIIEAPGIKVLRFRNEEVENDLSGVLRKIEIFVKV